MTSLLPENCEGYPVYYMTCNGAVLCADCATVEWNDKETGTMETDTPQVHWEGDSICCEGCNAFIRSAYGPVEQTKTKVHFKNLMNEWTGEPEVIALFPDEPYDHAGVMIMSYMHVGQHGGASRALLQELQDAMPWEYADLQLELEAVIGYGLDVVR